jgi:hypothetical protein
MGELVDHVRNSVSHNIIKFQTDPELLARIDSEG